MTNWLRKHRQTVKRPLSIFGVILIILAVFLLALLGLAAAKGAKVLVLGTFYFSIGATITTLLVIVSLGVVMFIVGRRIHRRDHGRGSKNGLP